MNKVLSVMALLLVFVTQARAQAPQLSHSTIFVTDLNRAVNFYKNVMELPIIPEPFHDGKHVWFKTGPHSQIHVVSGAREDISHDVNIHTAFSVPSVEEFEKHLDQSGQKYGNWNITAKTIQLRPDGIKQIYLQDPDGYWIEINDDKE